MHLLHTHEEAPKESAHPHILRPYQSQVLLPVLIMCRFRSLSIDDSLFFFFSLLRAQTQAIPSARSFLMAPDMGEPARRVDKEGGSESEDRRDDTL